MEEVQTCSKNPEFMNEQDTKTLTFLRLLAHLKNHQTCEHCILVVGAIYNFDIS